MQSEAKTPKEYIEELPDERKEVVSKLHDVIIGKLDGGFTSNMAYKMIGYGIPHSVFPDGYHCKPSDPVPFMNLASQKNYVAVYHMGLYMDDVLEWFQAEYPKHCKRKLDMGKCCIRFKKMDDIPYELIGQLTSKVSLEQWLDYYIKTFVK